MIFFYVRFFSDIFYMFVKLKWEIFRNSAMLNKNKQLTIEQAFKSIALFYIDKNGEFIWHFRNSGVFSSYYALKFARKQMYNIRYK